MTTKEEARKTQVDFRESMPVYEAVYGNDLPAGTHIMCGRWRDTMGTPTVWRSTYTARGQEQPHNDDGCIAVTATIQGVRKLLARCLEPRDQ